MAEPIVLVVNGKPHTVQADPETPLLYVLRNELGLTGPQFGCGEENCGARRCECGLRRHRRTGARLRQMPFMPERVRAALLRQAGSGLQ